MEKANLIQSMPPQTLKIFEALAAVNYRKKFLQQFETEVRKELALARAGQAKNGTDGFGCF